MIFEYDIERTLYVRAHGNCADVDFNVFFPVGVGSGGRPRKDGARKNPTTEDLERAVIEEYCASCPAKAECLELALSYDGNYAAEGVWGGTNFEDRKIIRRERKEAAAA